MRSGETTLNARISARVAALRAEKGWTLEDLATRTDISRASLSRLERGELSPTAEMLNTLCSAFGWTLSHLMADAEGVPSTLIKQKDQMTWTDPQTGYTRRLISPPTEQMKGELLEIEIPAGAIVNFEGPALPGLEHHLWILDGVLQITIGREAHRLEPGDCFRYRLFGPSRFQSEGKVRYLLSIIRP